MNYHKVLYLAWFPLFVAACRPTPLPPEPTGVASEAAVLRSLHTVDPERSLALFDYDRSQPVDIHEQDRWVEDGIAWMDFSYESPLGGRVPARTLVPSGRGPFPAILLMHGSDGDIELFSDAAFEYAKLGAVVMLIESPHIRPGNREFTGTIGYLWPYFTEQDRLDQIQLMVDLRRAIDILQEYPFVDHDRLAFVGYSYGAAMGGLLAGIEDRLQAYVLVVGDGGLIEHTSEPLDNGMPDHFQSQWVDEMWPIEPIHFVHQAAPAALLFQNGVQDELVSPSDAIRFQTAGSEPKTVIWYEAGHNLVPGAFRDAAVWLQEYIGSPLIWMAPDYRPLALWVDWTFTLWICLSLLSVSIIFRRERRRAEPEWRRKFLWLTAGMVLGPLGLALHMISVVHEEQREGAVKGSDWRFMLEQAVLAGMIYTLGSLLGNLVSYGLLDGDYVVLTYLTPLLGGWILIRAGRKRSSFRPLGWLVAVNLLWAADVLFSYPLMGMWGLRFLWHPRLLWYIGSLTLVNIGILFGLYPILRKYGLVAADQVRKRRISPDGQRLSWPVRLGVVITTFAIDILAVTMLIANMSDVTWWELLRSFSAIFA